MQCWVSLYDKPRIKQDGKKELIQINRFEPSSKLCNVCGTKNIELKLRHRIWKCNGCYTSHDRDINAAINIRKIRQGMSELTPAERTPSGCILGDVR